MFTFTIKVKKNWMKLDNQVSVPYCSSHASSLADLGVSVSTLLIQITELGTIFV